MHDKLLLTICLILPFLLIGQVNNDDCSSAMFISDIENFCSSPNSFSNNNAQESAVGTASCWLDESAESDVWYSFAPSLPGVRIQLFGARSNSLESLDNASLAVYDGSCGNLNELLCSNVLNGNNNQLERILTDLVIGRNYYIRVSSDRNSEGTFQLCIDQYVPVKSPESDCNSSVVLCDKSSFAIEILEGVGDDPNEVEESCIAQEFASAWYTWTAENNGSLTFTITPNNLNDPREDLDFALYRLPNGLGDCSNKELLKCMASGETAGQTNNQNAPCLGATGLRQGDPDEIEFPGCDIGDNNFLSPLQMIAGESYALVVNNFSESGFGFNIEFGGTGEFLGPEPIFDITATDAFECDKTIVFSDQSLAKTDDIVAYRWNFGDGALPLFAEGIGPHDVLYESFGEKVAALTIETSRGCTRTEIVKFNVAACCSDMSDLSLSSFSLDLICAGVAEGSIEAIGLGGFPEYKYDLNGEGYSTTSIYNGLLAGDYTLSIQDLKGCEETINITLTEPPPLVVMVSDDDSVDLGFSLPLTSEFEPDDRMVQYDWGPTRGLSCADCPNPVATPPGTTTYTLTITDQDGCTATDNVTLSTPNVRPIVSPNIIDPTKGNENSYLWISANIAATEILEYKVFDRWGSVLYSTSNQPVSDAPFQGWDGRVSGKFANPGVYVWMAKIKFVDDVEQVYSGDVTIVR